MIRNYLKTAIRNLLRNKGYSFIHIIGLSLGLTAAILIILYVKDELSFDRFHLDADLIYRVDRKIKRDNGNIDNSGYSGYFQGPRFSESIPEIKGFVRFQNGQTDIKIGDNIFSEQVRLTDANFFSVFSFPLVEGDANAALGQPRSVVLSESMSRKLFGSADAMGKTIMFRDGNGFSPYLVSAVSKDCPANSSIQFNILLPIEVSPQDQNRNENWFQFFLTTFVVLKPGADIHAVNQKMDRVFLSDARESIKMIKEKYGVKELGLSYFLQPMSEIHLSRNVPSDGSLANSSNPVYSYLLSAIALFILLIACVNFINLSVAHSLKRAKEIGIRKVIGGSRQQLLVQFLGESLLLCLGAILLAFTLMSLILPIFNQLADKSLSLSYLFDWRLILELVALFSLTVFLAGFYPALVLSGYNPVQTLYRRFSMGGRSRIQKSLVVFQFTLSSFLIIATLAISSQFSFLTTQKLGYDDEDLVVVNRFESTGKDAQLFKSELMKNASIVAVAPKNNGFQGNTVKVDGDVKVNVTVETVDASFLGLMNVPIVEGRNFSPEFPSDSSKSVLVNETFVKEAGWKNPIGMQVGTFEDKKYTVVGVVKDYHYKHMTEKIGPQLFTMNPNNNYGSFYIKIRPGSETAAVNFIQGTFRSLFPLSAFDYNFVKQDNQASYREEAKWKKILFLGSMLTIFVSCIGLYGLSVFSAEKRRKEVGIRKVLGASASRVAYVLSLDFPLAWMTIDKWLENYPYRISLGGWLFFGAAMMVIGIALLTVSFQSVRAALANPVTSLRSE
jgi:putative ABC transport system permease protein